MQPKAINNDVSQKTCGVHANDVVRSAEGVTDRRPGTDTAFTLDRRRTDWHCLNRPQHIWRENARVFYLCECCACGPYSSSIILSEQQSAIVPRWDVMVIS